MRKILFCLIFLITACSSIPLSTMIKMSSFDEDDFIRLQADEIRLKITINDTIPLQDTTTELAVEITDTDGTLNLSFPLETVKVEYAPATTSLFKSRPAYNIYIFRLTPAGIDNFNKIQGLLKTKKNSSISFSAGISDLNVGLAREQDVYLTIDLKLDQAGGYLTIVESWKMEFDA